MKQSVFLLFCSIILLTGCEYIESPNEVISSNDSSSLKATDSNTSIQNKTSSHLYKIPTPNRVFEIINATNPFVETSTLNPISNKHKYVTKNSKALNFGVYFSDLAFASKIKNKDLTVSYFNTLEYLSKDLGIGSVFNETISKKIEHNLDNIDSLALISNSTYYDVYSYLEMNELGKELITIIVGGWIESTYTLSKLIEGYDQTDPVIELIADQKYLLENLLVRLYDYDDEENISNLILKLDSILQIYDQLEVEVEETLLTKNNKGYFLIEGGESIKMNQKSYQMIINKISELRLKIINGE